MVAALVATLAVLTGCTVQTTGQGSRASTAPTASPSASPTATASLKFTDCTSLIDPRAAGVPAQRARNLEIGCGRLPVPLDYADPSGPTVSLYVLRIHDTTSSGQAPLVVNPGGPGGSSVSLAVGLAGRVADDVLASYDIIGIDPRGVGLSSAITCLSDSQKDTVFAAAPDVRTAAGVAEAGSLARMWATGCRKAVGKGLGDYNTVYAARDMETLRTSLGAKKLDYLGYSYGTLLGAVYATQFPTTVGRMVLDGAIDPGLGFQQGSEVQLAGFEKAFGQFATYCESEPDCQPMGDPAEAVTTLVKTATTSGGIPVSTSGEDRKATAGVVYSAVAEALYDQDSWSTLADAIISGQKGDGRGLLALADQYYQRDSSGRYTNLFDAFTVVTCNDGGVTFTGAQLTSLGTAWAKKYPVFGAYFAGQLAMCNGWPASGHTAPTSVPAAGAPPIVVVGTVNDPATPYGNSAKLAQSLGTGVVLTWQGQGHTAYLKNECIDDAVDAYLVEGTAPKPKTTCPAR